MKDRKEPVQLGAEPKTFKLLYSAPFWEGKGKDGEFASGFAVEFEGEKRTIFVNRSVANALKQYRSDSELTVSLVENEWQVTPSLFDAEGNAGKATARDPIEEFREKQKIEFTQCLEDAFSILDDFRVKHEIKFSPEDLRSVAISFKIDIDKHFK